MSLISLDDRVGDCYSWLLRQKRAHEKLVDSGKAKCLHCQRQKSVHLSDDRCSPSAVSRTFRNEQQEDLNKITKAIALIEELMEL